MTYFHNLFPVKVYTEEVPADLEIPALYFPTAFEIYSNDTNMTYTKTYALTVSLFHHSVHEAKSEAEHIVDTIRRERNAIPLLNEDGNHVGQFIQIKRIETRMIDNVASIAVNWDSRYHYDREKSPSLEGVEFNLF